MTYPLVHLRRIASFAYGDSLADAVRNNGDVPVYGSNGPVGRHDVANTLGRAIVIGRKGSFGKVQFSEEPLFAIDTTFYVDERHANADLRWLYYALQTLRLDELSEDVGVPGLSRDKAYAQRLPLPLRDDQRAIADYLDRETARIDALISAKERQRDLTAERLRSWTYQTLETITLAVPLKSVARWVEGPGIMAHEFRETGVPLLRIRNLVGDTIDLSNCGYVDPHMVAMRWRHLCVRAGELLVSGSARSGSPVVVPREADGSVPYTGLIRIWPTSVQLLRDYLRLFLTSPQFEAQIDRLKTGVGLQHWGPYHLGQLRLPLPSPEGQTEMVATFREKESSAVLVQHLLERQVALLREHRQALITGAVTGEIHVQVAA